MKDKQMYAEPVVKTFKVSLEGNCCNQVSPQPIDPYTGLPLGSDTF